MRRSCAERRRRWSISTRAGSCGGETFEIEVALEPPPEAPRKNLTWIEGRSPLAGARTGSLSPAFAEELGLDPMRRGVVVAEVAARSPARNLGLRLGDILARINGREIRLVDDVLAVTNGEASTWRITIGRDDRQLKVVIGQ